MNPDPTIIAMGRFKNLLTFDYTNGDRRWVIHRLKNQMEENRQIRADLKRKQKFANQLAKDLRERQR